MTLEIILYGALGGLAGTFLLEGKKRLSESVDNLKEMYRQHFGERPEELNYTNTVFEQLTYWYRLRRQLRELGILGHTYK